VNVAEASPEEASPQNDNSDNNRDNSGPPAVSPISNPFFDKTTILFLVVIAEVSVFGGLAAAGTFSSGPSVSIP